jgi:hypothetical protein
MLVLAVAAVVMVLVFPGQDSPGTDHDSDTAYQ